MSEDSFDHPHFALANLFGFGLDRQIYSASSRELKLRGSDSVERIDRDTWELNVQGTHLSEEVLKIKRGCWRAITLTSGTSRSQLRTLRLGEESATFAINWDRATSASVTISGDRGGQSWTFDRFAHPITVRTHEGWATIVGPLEVTVVLRAGTKIIAAERSWLAGRV